MTSYIICINCNNLVEYTPETKYEGGTSYVYFKCPKCGHEKKISINHIHYGSDSLNK